MCDGSFFANFDGIYLLLF